nr:hypothetical protein SHINE37_44856 [Rhizobiaceae bacterium]
MIYCAMHNFVAMRNKIAYIEAIQEHGASREGQTKERRQWLPRRRTTYSPSHPSTRASSPRASANSPKRAPRRPRRPMPR